MVGEGGSPWVKADALADGVAKTSGDVLIAADADVWVDNLAGAVDALVQGAPWVMPHLYVHRLSQDATERVLEGAVPAAAARDHGCDQSPYPGWAGGGVVVLRRDDYQRAPLDTRFFGWGQEDASWALALDTIVGHHTRLDGDLWHLWHPPQSRMSRRVGSPEGEDLWRRYRKAARNPQQMRALIDETKAAIWQPKS